jgi:metal-responsive CopG/Arc/MetJ family transcriptional regulator
VKKMTFTLDEAATRELDRASQRLGMAKSKVVREALRVYGEHLGRLSDEEREAKLAAFDRLVPAIPERARDDVEAELTEVRRARRAGGRRSPRR